MKVKVLTDNTAGYLFLAEHGLSFYIEFKDRAFLLDAGSTDVFLKNAEKLQLNLQQKVGAVFLSHGHGDHGNGLKYLKNKTLVAHPDVFMSRFHKGDDEQVGLALSQEEIESNYQLIVSREPYRIYEDVIFLGEIPRKNNFESKSTPFVDASGNPDFVPDDSAVCFVENDSIVILTGCSHAGICNIIDYAIEVTGISKIKAVMGGFHLLNNDIKTEKTIEYLKQMNIQHVIPSHCTALPALLAFSAVFKPIQVKTGMTFEF
jgi:7,8-dihydropterin-6-yl-methyl-4-(beta-D-ribofuranosyl)aminobenzene 5'-phosphate synthase